MNKENFQFIAFLLLSFVCYKCLFYVIYRQEMIFEMYKILVGQYIDLIIYFCVKLLSIGQIKLEVYDYQNLIRIPGSGGVIVGEPCIGLGLSSTAAAFVIAARKSVHLTITAITSSIAAIYVLNVFRISGLVLLSHYQPEWVEINHKWIFQSFIMLVLVALWRWLIKKKLC